MDAEHDGQDAERIVTLPVAAAPKVAGDEVREVIQKIRRDLFRLEILISFPTLGTDAKH